MSDDSNQLEAVSENAPASDKHVETIAALVRHYREMKHSSTNALAVMMALAEMTRKNPVHLDRFCEMVLERGAEMVSQLGKFGDAFRDYAESELAIPAKELQPRENNE